MNHRAGVQWRLTAFAALATLLTSLSLTPTVTEGGWGGRTIFCVITVALTGGVCRQLSMPSPVIPLVQIAALTLFLAATFSSAVAVVGVLPGPGVWKHFIELLDQGLTVTWNEAPPVTGTDGVAFLLAAGVGVIAVAVDALSVTWHRSTLAGIPLFVLYLVPAAVLPEGVPWPLFALAGTGWVLLQLAEGRERLSRWGKLIGSRSEGAGNGHGVGGTGRRLGAGALAAAVVIPIVLPSLQEGVFGSGSGDGDGAGSGSGVGVRRVVTVNPIVDLRRNLIQGDDAVVLHYTTTDPTPQYLRIATLDQFDGTTWTLEEMQAGDAQRAADGLPPPPGLSDDVSRTEVTTDVEVVGLNTRRLPLPYPVTRVDIEGDWRWDVDTFDVFSADEGGNAQGTSYTATSFDIEPTTSQLSTAPLPGEELGRYLILDNRTRSLLQADTERVTAGMSSQYDQALALQNWFRGFDYSLATQAGNGQSDLASFLADRSGYCEQFAASMALMARVAGIPSRVQVGFTPGTQLEDGTWEVTAHDAHAWPELWFERTGWVRFEPTPGGGDGNATPGWAPPPAPLAGTPGARNGAGSGSRGGVILRRTGSGTPADDRRVPADPRGSRGGATGADGLTGTENQGGRPWTPYLLVLLLLGALGAITPRAARDLSYRRRWAVVADERSAVQAAWADVLDAATDLDLPPRPTETTRDLARRLPHQGGLSGATRARFLDLAQAVERAKYAGQPPTGESAIAEADQTTLPMDTWRTIADDVCDALFDAVSARDRRRARWWPMSGRLAAANWWTKQSNRFDGEWGTFTASVTGRLRRS